MRTLQYASVKSDCLQILASSCHFRILRDGFQNDCDDESISYQFRHLNLAANGVFVTVTRGSHWGVLILDPANCFVRFLYLAYIIYISKSHFFYYFPCPARLRFQPSQHNNLTFTNAYKKLVIQRHPQTHLLQIIHHTHDWILAISICHLRVNPIYFIWNYIENFFKVIIDLNLILSNLVPIEAELSQVYLCIKLYFCFRSFPFSHKINTNVISCLELCQVYRLYFNQRKQNQLETKLQPNKKKFFRQFVIF